MHANPNWSAIVARAQNLQIAFQIQTEKQRYYSPFCASISHYKRFAERDEASFIYALYTHSLDFILLNSIQFSHCSERTFF